MKEALETARKRDLCVWFREGQCAKGLPGTPCEVKGCVAWTDHLNWLEEKVAKYIGYPREIDESSTTYARREAFKDGYLLALKNIKTEALRMMYSAERPHDLADLVKFIESKISDGSL